MIPIETALSLIIVYNAYSTVYSLHSAGRVLYTYSSNYIVLEYIPV